MNFFLAQDTCLKDRKLSGRLVRRCAPGTELVDWLLSLSSSIQTRAQATGMWQAILEEGIISHGKLKYNLLNNIPIIRKAGFWKTTINNSKQNM